MLKPLLSLNLLKGSVRDQKWIDFLVLLMF